MGLESLSKLYLPAIEQELHAVIDRAFTSDYHELRFMLTYHLGWEGGKAGPEAQGKRIRPLLVLLCAGASVPDNFSDSQTTMWKKALPAAASVELLHNFSLIHDDIQDHSPLRRGRPTVWMEWGIPQAINAGDTMFSLAQIAMLNLSDQVDFHTVLKANQLLNQTCLSLTQGQFLDISYESETIIPLEAYWPMITGKTAALLSTCTALGALISDTTSEVQSAFHDFGHFLGLAFQAQDDLLGLWGNHEQIGKSTTSDLVSGKKSLPVLYGLSQNGAFSQRWLAGPIQPEDAQAVALLLEEEGAKTYTQQVTDTLTQRALTALETALPTKNENGQALFELANSLLNRRS
jgi:geranylgeranyl diphosphate synthase type I